MDVEMAARDACEYDRIEDLKTFEEAGREKN